MLSFSFKIKSGVLRHWRFLFNQAAADLSADTKKLKFIKDAFVQIVAMD
jgi:hypothetical protein